MIIQWDDYRPPADMQVAIDAVNRLSTEEIQARLPIPGGHNGGRATFSFRIYTQYDLNEVEKVYVIIGGFAEQANTLDAGIKGLLVDALAEQINSGKYAIVIIGGLFSFPVRERDKLLKQGGSGSLLIVAEEVARLLKSKFKALHVATVSGYSMGGVMAPLVARAIIEQGVATVDQVGCGEPTYAALSTTGFRMLQRTARASAYRNEQIKASAIPAYISAKKAPGSTLARAAYRARLYRPLVRRLPSMRLVVRDLALQASDYPPTSRRVQLREALHYLAENGVTINLLHAEHSIICQASAFYQLADDLREIADSQLQLIIIKGLRADHGIEEQRSLSTPFLVKPDIYASLLA